MVAFRCLSIENASTSITLVVFALELITELFFANCNLYEIAYWQLIPIVLTIQFLRMTGVLFLVAALLLILGVKSFSKIKAPTRALKSWQETKDIIAGE
jgi:hypothetical protein